MQATLTSASFLRSSMAPAGNAAALQPSTAEGTVHAVDSSTLLQGQKAVAISHNGSLYRLQATKLGKLILTK
ncbi:hemin uptake protein HemP [Acidovorax sp. DW039]|uniref:hemin uptake protein HemP n=2 Tax=Acidovorax sp. DW039 TaxID=3095606 RepID=UPI00308FE009|nr:hemin uptake protein HemP [Acidovorax sp. DW039]